MNSIIPQLLMNAVVAGATYTLIALGFNLIFGVTKFVNMAHGAMVAVGAYTFFFLTRLHAVPLALALLITVLFSGFMGWLSYWLIFLPLRRRRSSRLVLFVASVGIMIVVQALLAMIFSTQFQTLDLGLSREAHVLGAASFTSVQALIFFVSIGIFISLYFFMKKTMFGRAVAAVGDDEEVAKIIGINTDAIIGRTFFMGSALAGLAGVFIGTDIGLSPAMGLLALLEGATSSIIGGIGSISGAFVGSYIEAAAENFGIWKIPSEWKGAITFGLLVVFLVFRPNGLMNKKK